MNKEFKVLLLGGTGKLGKKIIESGFLYNLFSPSRDLCDLNNKKSIDELLLNYKPSHIINCAALARRKICEKDPKSAIMNNIIGTANLVQSVLDFSALEKEPRLLHISTDAVYHCSSGNYDEYDPTIPICNYGWSKLGAECSIRLLKDFLIVRTRFYDPDAIPFDDAANDIYTSSIPILKLIDYLNQLLFSNYVGVINVGEKRDSDYRKYKTHKPQLIMSDLNSIQKESSLPFCGDYSLSIKRLEDLLGN